MTGEQVKKIFEESHALLSGHFWLSSGNHSNQYLQCAKVTQYPKWAAQLAESLSHSFLETAIDVVLGPALGGVVIAQETTQALYRQGNKAVRAIFCERENGKMTLRRGFTLEPGEKVLIVEDVVTTGGSVAEAIEVVNRQGAQVVGVGCFIDRRIGKLPFDYPLTSLLKIAADIYPPAECPLCQKQIPVVKPGSKGLR